MVVSKAPGAVKYNVVVHPVQEVTLIGSADLAYWRAQLAGYALHPTVANGHAEMLISATSARFMGKAFRELSFSVFVSEVEGTDRRDGAFMVHAFNSSRLFAWIERTFFHTPYYPGSLEVSARSPLEVRLTSGEISLLHVLLESPGRTPIRELEEGWEGPIHLWKGAAGDPQRLFFARLWGHTRVYPFDAVADVFDAQGCAKGQPFRWLSESGFSPREWHIREVATHSKSKTHLLDGQG